METVFRRYLARGAYQSYVMCDDSKSAFKNACIHIGFDVYFPF